SHARMKVNSSDAASAPLPKNSKNDVSDINTAHHINTKQESMGTQVAAENFTLELGMPMLGRSGLNENALLKLIGHDRWETLSRLGGVRTSQIRDSFDNRLYATYCYVELALAPDRPLSAYDENDCLNFSRGDLCHYSRVYL